MRKFALLFALLILLPVVLCGCGGDDSSKKDQLKAGETMCHAFSSRELLLYAEYRDVNGKLELRETDDRIYSYFEIFGNPTKGKNCWPAISLFSNTAPALISTKDFLQYKGLRIDVKNENNAPCTFNLIIFDKNYVRYKDYSIELEAYSEWKIFEVEFRFGDISAENEIYKDYYTKSAGYLSTDFSKLCAILTNFYLKAYFSLSCR